MQKTKEKENIVQDSFWKISITKCPSNLKMCGGEGLILQSYLDQKAKVSSALQLKYNYEQKIFLARKFGKI